MKRYFTLTWPALLTFLLMTPVAAADPINPIRTHGFVWAFPAEILVILAVLVRYRFDCVRFFLVWLPITIDTFVVFILCGTELVERAIGYLAINQRHPTGPHSDSWETVFAIVALGILELLVVLVEACAIYWLGKKAWMRRNHDKHLTFRAALMASVLGNLVSAALPFLWT